jgi:predicted dehydrogenase
MTDEPIRLAIVGCGAIAEAHRTAVEESELTTLVAGVDPDPEARRRAAEAWGCPTFATIVDMLRETEVDAACVCAPPAFHRELCELLFEAGIHVLCEKPLAPTEDDAIAMVKRAMTAGVVLKVSSKFRYVDDLRSARRKLWEGAIGDPVSYEVAFCAQVPMGSRWNVRPEVSGGGVVMDNAAHALDVLHEVLYSPIDRVWAEFPRSTLGDGVEDSAEIQFQTRGGALGRVVLSWTYFTKDLDYLVVQGTKGTLRVGWTGGQIRRHGEREWADFGAGYDKREAFAELLQAFAVRVHAPAPPTPDPDRDAVLAVQFIERVYEARRTGRWQDLEVEQPPLSESRRTRQRVARAPVGQRP